MRKLIVLNVKNSHIFLFFHPELIFKRRLQFYLKEVSIQNLIYVTGYIANRHLEQQPSLSVFIGLVFKVSYQLGSVWVRA